LGSQFSKYFRIGELLVLLVFRGIEIKELQLYLGFWGSDETMSSEFWVFQKPHHWVSCTKKNPMAFWAVICLSSKDFTTLLMYQNRVLDLFENYDYFRTTSLKNHLDTQHGFWCGF
jgi:hypothetical protein